MPKVIAPGMTVEVIRCHARVCTNDRLVGQKGSVLRTDSKGKDTRALVGFRSGYLQWLPFFHLKVVA